MSLRVLVIALLVQLVLGAAFIVFAVIGFPAFGASATAPARAHGAASSKTITAKLSYDETNPGAQKGAATIGIKGHGTFSAKLGAHGALDAAVIALATGVPITKIIRGGSYVVQRDVAANGVVTGTAVASFKAHGLGKICVTYKVTPGPFVPGDTFVPMSGRVTTAGGTGAAAHWRGTVSFKQTGVTGMSIEQFSATGSARGSTGAAKAMSAACKHVAAIHG